LKIKKHNSMENNRAKYKQIKINWWVFILFGGIHVWVIFAYIHQWGSRSMDETGFIIMSIIWIFVYIFIGRSKVIINDNQVVFRSDVWIPIKIPIVNIKSVSVKQVSWINLYIPEKNTEKLYFGFVKQAIGKAENEYKKYQAKTLSEVEKAYLESIKDVQKVVENKKTQ